MIILDAGVGSLTWTTRTAIAVSLLAAAIDENFGANPLTLAEVLVGPVREGRLASAQTALRDLEVDELPFPLDAAARLAHLRAETRLRMPACCVVLAAEGVSGTVASFDDRLVQAARDRDLPVLTH